MIQRATKAKEEAIYRSPQKGDTQTKHVEGLRQAIQGTTQPAKNPNDTHVFRIRLFSLIKAKQFDDPTLNTTSVERNN